MSDARAHPATKCARVVAVLALGLQALSWTRTPAPWPLALAANLLPLLLLPSAGLAPFYWLRRDRGDGLLHGLCAACLVAALLPAAREELALRRPEASAPPPPVPAGADLRVFWLNLGNGLASREATAAWVRAAGVDVVALAEVNRGVAAYLADELADAFPHAAIHPGWLDGKAVFSRHPIVEHELFRLGQGRPYLRATLAVGEREVVVYVVHLSPMVAVLGARSGAARDLARLVAAAPADRAVVLAGDLNATERSAEYAGLVRAGFRDAFADAGRGFGASFPVFGRYFGLPVGRFLRIDYLWTRHGLATVAARLGPDLGSDHLPLVADFAWE